MTFYSIVDRMKEKITVNISWPENITEKFLVENYQKTNISLILKVMVFEMPQKNYL